MKNVTLITALAAYGVLGASQPDCFGFDPASDSILFIRTDVNPGRGDNVSPSSIDNTIYLGPVSTPNAYFHFTTDGNLVSDSNVEEDSTAPVYLKPITDPAVGQYLTFGNSATAEAGFGYVCSDDLDSGEAYIVAPDGQQFWWICPSEEDESKLVVKYAGDEDSLSEGCTSHQIFATQQFD